MQTIIDFDDRSAAHNFAADRRAEKNPGEQVLLRDSIVPRVTIKRFAVGDVATYSIGSDSYAGRIIEATPASVVFEFDRSGRTVKATRRRDGVLRPVGSSRGSAITVGVAINRLDPSF